MKSGTILIVDDETNIRLMLRTTLQSVGYTVRQAANGREAIEAVEREVPDLMILDLSMPLLDGLGVLQELKDLGLEEKPRVIVLTAYGSVSMAVKATRLGAVDFLEKPVLPDEVREAVMNALTAPTLPPRATGHDGDSMNGGYTAVLDRIRKALRLGQYADAETLLMKAADIAEHDAPYFNLLGVLYEAQQEWRLAKKFYGKAIRLDRQYTPSQTNMRRIYELETWGRSQHQVTLGDELAVWLENAGAPTG